MRRALRISSVLVLLGAFAAGCGGGGGSSAPALPPAPPADARTNTTSISQQSVHAVSSAFAPTAAAAPKTLGRAASRASRRTLNSVTSTIGNIQGNVGETFTITYTNEPSDNCLLNGTLNGTVTARTATSVSVSLSGTLAYTGCSGSPNVTTTVTSGSMTVTSTTVAASLPMHFAFSGKTYTMDIAYAMKAADDSGTMYLTDEAYTGSDSLGNTFDFGNVYYSTGQAYQSYNKNKINGTTNNITAQFYATKRIVAFDGTSTLANNIVIYYYGGSNTNPFTLNYVEYKNTSGDIVTYDVGLLDGTIGFRTNSNYTGTFTRNVNGSGSGSVSDPSAATVASISWTSGGLCSVNYTDSAITDEQFYNTNIEEALAN